MSHVGIIKLVKLFTKLASQKFTGSVRIIFNQGGIQGVKQVIETSCNLENI